MCPASDVLGALVEAIGDFGVEDAVGGAALAAGGADAAGAFGGVGDATAGLGDVSSASLADAGPISTDLGASTDAGLSSGLNNLTASLGGSATDAVGGGAGSTTAAITPPVGGTGGLLPEQTVTAASTAPGSVGAGPGLGNLGLLGGAALAGGAGGGGSGAPGPATSGLANQTGPLTANNDISPGALSTDTGPGLDTGGSFLPATSGDSLQSLSPDIMNSLGIDPSGGVPAASPGGDFDLSNAAVSPSDTGIDPNAPAAAGGGGSSSGGIGSWLSNPKNDATAGLLGLSLKNALTKPSLPSSDVTASNIATQEATAANSVIKSGGTATPQWASQKASIDTTINQQIQQQTQAILQAAAANGEGDKNSGVVQQQIAQMTQNANVQRQQLYLQAQQQNVTQAISELTGGDNVLTSIGATQLQQSEQAMQQASQTAELALLLQSGTGVKIPGASGVVAGS